MNRFDLCIVLNGLYQNAFAVILDMDYEYFYHMEIWDFEKFDGATIDYINIKDLRLATKEEKLIYRENFKKYCNKNSK